MTVIQSLARESIGALAAKVKRGKFRSNVSRTPKMEDMEDFG